MPTFWGGKMATGSTLPLANANRRSAPRPQDNKIVMAIELVITAPLIIKLLQSLVGFGQIFLDLLKGPVLGSLCAFQQVFIDKSMSVFRDPHFLPEHG